MDLTRVESLLGAEATAKLQRSHVAVFGLGGVGSHVAEALARSGVGALTLVDADKLEPSNINRQLPALQTTMGRLKTDAMAERIAAINPACRVSLRSSFYRPGDFELFLPELPDFVADAIDATPSKTDLLAECYRRGVPVVSSMGTGNKLDPSQLRLADISATHTCPLARSVRRGLRLRGIERGIAVVFSTEEPVCAVRGEAPGSMIFVPAASGMLMAAYIVRQLAQRM